MAGTAKFAVLGAAGQLGRELMSQLPPGTIGLTRTDIDLVEPAQAAAVLGRIQPTVVINCAAYNLVDAAEDQPAAALAINALGARELARVCRELNATLVHFSTDYVFGADADRRTPYTENDMPGPLSAYGVSKLAGEYFVQACSPRNLIIRTCGLYGRHGAGGKGGNFVETMLRLGATGKTIKVVNDQTLTPSSVVDVAAGTLELLRSGASGLHHVTNAGECSWYEFAQAVFQLSGMTVDLQPISSADYGSKTARPRYSVLTTSHLNIPRLRHWREALRHYLAERTEAKAV